MPDPVVLDRHDDLAAGLASHPDDDVAAVGAELHRVVDEVDEDLAEPRLVAADRRQAGSATSTREAHALALGEQPEPLRRLARRPARGRRRRGASSGPPLSIRARSSSSLTIWARWPVSTSILRDPLAHLRRARASPARLGVAGQRLGQEADRRERRAQLVRQVVDELGPDPLEAAQLGDVLEDEPDAADRRAPGPDDEGRAVRAAAAGLAATRHPVSGGLRAIASMRWSPNASIAVRPSIEPAARPQEHVGRGVRELDAQVVVEPDDADAHEVGEVGQVAEPLLERELGGLGRGAAAGGRDREVLVVADSAGRRPVRLGEPIVDRLERRGHGPGRCRGRSRARSPGPPTKAMTSPSIRSSIAQPAEAVPCGCAERARRRRPPRQPRCPEPAPIGGTTCVCA